MLVTIEQVRKIISTIPIQHQDDWKWIIHFCAKATDDELADIIYDLPVQDIQAINTRMIKGKYFAEFATVMKITSSYERKIQQFLTLAQETLEHADFSGMALRKHIRRICALKILAIKDKKKRKIPKDDLINTAWDLEKAVLLIPKTFPQCQWIINGNRTPEKIKFALGELKEELQRSRMRFSTTRRRYFRKAISLNYEAILKEFLDTKGRNLKLHKTRIDRLVIDVYHPELMTFHPEVMSILSRNEAERNVEFAKSRIIPQSKIDALRKIEGEFTAEADIDSITKQWESDRQEQLEKGFASRGKIIQKYPWGKVEFTYEPHSIGAPIRLRLITNVQNCIRQELFDRYPDKEAMYKASSWGGNSEINFILPQDYDYYYQSERPKCDWLYSKAKELFMQLIKEALDMAVQNPDKLIVYVSQFEICWEEPLERTHALKPFTKLEYPALSTYLNDKAVEMNGIGNYVNCKIENGRPSFYCDIASLDPTTPVMQYKIYPKFHIAGKTYLRHELTNTKFSKLIDSSIDREQSGLSYTLLNDPEFARKTFEEIFWLETYNHRGDGYNRRYSQDTSDEAQLNFFATLTAKAVFNQSYLSRTGDMIQLMRTGRCPKTIRGRPRRTMEELGIISKQNRGNYLATQLYLKYANGNG
ncbi:MAG: hypothetical protein V1934_00360 [Methanobacteriota archaeon]